MLYNRHIYPWLGIGMLTRFLVTFWVITHILPLQEHVDFFKGGPIILLSIPAFSHKIIYFLGSYLWLRQVQLSRVIVKEVSTIFYHLFVREFLEWLLSAECKYFPQGNTE